MRMLPIFALLVLSSAPALPVPVSQPAAAEVVIHADDFTQGGLHGAWTLAYDETSADRIKAATWDRISLASGDVVPATLSRVPLADPQDFFDVVFVASAETPYHVWLRLHAPDGAAQADSVWVQFSDARVNGQPVYELGTTSGLLVGLETCAGCAGSGWGWSDGSSRWQQPATVTFATDGPHTLRVQLRGQGVQVDQIVLSADRYLSSPPGSGQDDRTAVGRQ